MAKGGNGNSGATSAAGIGASVGTSNAATNSSTATNAAGNPGSAAAAQAAAAKGNAAAANAANSGKGSDSSSSGGISVNTGSNNAAVNSGNVTASYDNAGSLSGRGYASSTSGWGGGYGAAAAMDGLTTATQRGEDGRAQGSTAGGFGSGYATSSSKAAPTNMGSVFAGLGPVGTAMANAINAITGGSLNTGTYYGRVDGSGYYGPASTGDESSTTNAISNLGAATPSAPASTPAVSSPASVGSAVTDAVSSGTTLGLNSASNTTNNNTYSSGANSGATYRGGTVTDNGSGGSISSGITPPSRDTSSIGLGVYNPDKANYDQDNWNRGMEVQSSSLVSDEECKAFAKRAFSENTEPFKKVRVTIIKKV